MSKLFLRLAAFQLLYFASFVSTISPSTAESSWTQLGLSARPTWVEFSAERRLRLLPALRQIENNIQAKVNDYFGQKGPGMSVGLVLDSGLFYSQGFGFADAFRTQRPDEYTVFRPGSLSKVITATALLTIIDADKSPITLGTSAEPFIPQLKWVCDVWNVECTRGSMNNKIRLRHLVSHTSGLPNVLPGDNGWGSWLNQLAATWLQFKPGTRSAYSGVGIEAVGYIEHFLSGLSYPDFVKKRLFDPLRMSASGMDPRIVTTHNAQIWYFDGVRFVMHGPLVLNDLSGEALYPAGGLSTNVMDLSHFIKMFLTGKAPVVNDAPIIKPTTITTATNSLFSADPDLAPKSCNPILDPPSNVLTDFQPCGPADAAGVGWFLTPPLITHNGDLSGFSGSNTELDITAQMGATGMVSTDPAKTDPHTGISPGFIDPLVDTMLSAGKVADKATDWSGQALSIGVARLLNLSGKVLTPGDLANLKPDFVAAQHLTSDNVVSYLTAWRAESGSCATFRVTGASSTKHLDLVLSCQTNQKKVALDVEPSGDHQIAWAVSIPMEGQCVAQCGKTASTCLDTAPSSAAKSMCVHENETCQAACK